MGEKSPPQDYTMGPPQDYTAGGRGRGPKGSGGAHLAHAAGAIEAAFATPRAAQASPPPRQSPRRERERERARERASERASERARERARARESESEREREKRCPWDLMLSLTV